MTRLFVCPLFESPEYIILIIPVYMFFLSFFTAIFHLSMGSDWLNHFPTSLIVQNVTDLFHFYFYAY